MAKEPLDTEKILPSPQSVTAVAQNINPDNVNKIALRRGKVRELVRMGYEPYQIPLILEKGIKVGKNKIITVPISETIVKNDVEYIRQEDASIDIDFSEKRAEILDKLRFLYNRAITEYMNAKGQARNSFMNTALSVLSKITEIEGVKAPESLDINLGEEAKISKYAIELHKLSENDKSNILTAIREVHKKRQLERDGNSGVSSGKPRIPVQTSGDERVPRKS